MQSSPPSDAVPDERLRLIVESYQRLTGKPLLVHVPAESNALRQAIWTAPVAIVAHGTEADPVFFYGNAYALRCFEMSFGEFARLPSRLSAEPMLQEAREKALRKVAEQGYTDGYSGMRIAKSGRRFMITECTIWNLADANGVYHGQAAVFIAAP
jgi:hypothetical protein